MRYYENLSQCFVIASFAESRDDIKTSKNSQLKRTSAFFLCSKYCNRDQSVLKCKLHTMEHPWSTTFKTCLGKFIPWVDFQFFSQQLVASRKSNLFSSNFKPWRLMKQIIGNTSTWGLYFNLEFSPSSVFIPSLVLVKEFSKKTQCES